MTAEQQALENDREVKKKIVAEVISVHSNDSSQFEDLRKIGQALQAGDKLLIDIITGGVTNFSYRISLERRPEVQLYAKLTFSRALWNPDPDSHYDPERTVNEFKMMQIFNTVDPGSVATPYLCVDVGDMKILVTQWSFADEQWANQFLDGTVDMRIVPKIASALAKLHCMDFDPNFNNGIKEALLDFYAQTKAISDLFDLDTAQNNRVSNYARELGRDTCEDLRLKFMENLQKCECLAHNDAHMFNILVERKPNTDTLEQFGPQGLYVLCDWEMSISSSLGRDIGVMCAWPVACIVSHAINGNKQVSESILDMIELLWTEYSSALREYGHKDAEELRIIYRSVIGQLGSLIFFVYYSLGIHVEFLPFEGNQSAVAAARECLGYVGLKFMMLGFGNTNAESCLGSLRAIFRAFVEEEIKYHVSSRPGRRNMRSSMLRATGRRISDAAIKSTLSSKAHLDSL